MLHAGLDLSRARLDVCLIDDADRLVEHTATPPDADGLRRLAERLRGRRVRAVIESMTGARSIHDTLEEFGWVSAEEEIRRARVQIRPISGPRAEAPASAEAPGHEKDPALQGLYEWAIQDSNLGPLPYQRSRGGFAWTCVSTVGTKYLQIGWLC